MSAKQQLSEAIATLPDTLTLEEALERLYQTFQIKPVIGRAHGPIMQSARRPGSAKGVLQVPSDFDAPLADFADYQ